jgi:hypothetical protein
MDSGIPNNTKIFNSRGSYIYIKRRTPKFIIFDEYDKNGRLYKENTKRKVLKSDDALFVFNSLNHILIYGLYNF